MEMPLFPYAALQVSDQWLRNAWIYAKASSVEISAIGCAEIVGGKIRVSQPLHWLTQEGSAGHTRLDMTAVADVVADMVQSGHDPTMIRVWYHTHPKMSVFMSKIDMDTIHDDLARMMTPVVAVCANNKGELYWHITENERSVSWEQVLTCDAPTKEEIQAAKTILAKYVTEISLFQEGIGYNSLCTHRQGLIWCDRKLGHAGECRFREWKAKSYPFHSYLGKS